MHNLSVQVLPIHMERYGEIFGRLYLGYLYLIEMVFNSTILVFEGLHDDI